LELERSTYYYAPLPESEENLALMRAIDELYLKHPYYGSRRLAVELEVNRKHVQRLMRLMGLEAVYPKPRTTRRCPQHRIYPYLLRNTPITRPDQVWSTDITYIPLAGGYLYLTAVLDWYSSLRVGVAAIGQPGGDVLLRGLGRRLADESTGDLQHGSRIAVHQRGIHEPLETARHPDQHGRPRTRVGQRLRGALVADGEV